MARNLSETNLASLDVRRKLKPRGKPYWSIVDRGLHLGYRRSTKGKAGPWIARCYLGHRRYEEVIIGVSDDYSEADGVAVLDYLQAVEVARDHMKIVVQRKVGINRVSTGADETIESYTINGFCASHSISRATYYNLRKAGNGPREMHIGIGVRISREAATDWRHKCEVEMASTVAA